MDQKQQQVTDALESISELFASLRLKLEEFSLGDFNKIITGDFKSLDEFNNPINPDDLAIFISEYVKLTSLVADQYGIENDHDTVEVTNAALEAPDPEKYLREYFSEEAEVEFPETGDSSQPDQKDWRTEPPPIRDDVFNVPIEYEDYQEGSEQTYADTSNTVIPTAPSQEDDSTEIVDALERLIESIERLSEKMDEYNGDDLRQEKMPPIGAQDFSVGGPAIDTMSDIFRWMKNNG